MFTQEQINELLKNENVIKCSSESITYSKEFKLKAIKKYYEDGYSPNMIFREAGLDLSIIGRDRPKECLKRWRQVYKNKGKKELMKENRGGPRRKNKIKHKNSKEKIEYLETKIAYLEAENDFLAKLRGLKRE